MDDFHEIDAGREGWRIAFYNVNFRCHNPFISHNILTPAIYLDDF